MIGYKWRVDKDIVWRENQGGLMPMSPPSKLAILDRMDAKRILGERGCYFVRWESDFDSRKKYSWWHVIKDGSAAISSLSKNTRNQVRRGLKGFVCDFISRKVVKEEGYEVYCDAFARYQTHEKMFWRMEFESAIDRLPENTEIWGVREKETGRLVAFSENYIEENVCFYNTMWFNPGALKKYAAYALFFEMNRNYLEERRFSCVSDGARSLSHETQIHDFLISKFGFRKAYARLNVVYARWLSIAVLMAYPLRRWIASIPFGVFKKAAILLKQEQIRRECLGRRDGG